MASQKGQVHLATFSPVALAQCLNLPASPAVKWDYSTTSEAGFWEVYELLACPFTALCPHRELLPYLEEGRWGLGLQGFCPHLEFYVQFAANAERSQTTLQVTCKPPLPPSLKSRHLN